MFNAFARKSLIVKRSENLDIYEWNEETSIVEIEQVMDPDK